MLQPQHLDFRNLRSLRLFIFLVGIIFIGVLMALRNADSGEGPFSYKQNNRMRVQVHFDLKVMTDSPPLNTDL